MGAWGDGPFENDTAADWAFEIDEAEDARSDLIVAFDSAARFGSSDAALAEIAVAAAAWLTSLGIDSSNAAYAPRTAPPPIDSELREWAVRALRNATSSSSEWYQLWSVESPAPLEFVRRVLDKLTAS